MKQALIYARVSSKDQEREGYSIPAQLKLLRAYAASHEMQVVKEFIDVETAKTSGRKQFGEMVRFFESNPSCKTLIVEKTDRLYRNFKDYVTLEDLDLEIHLPKEGQVLCKESKSQAKLVHGIQLVIARNYIENLKEEVKKGMREKAEQGIFPGRPPLGYRNNKADHTIEIDPGCALTAERIFELYGRGNHSLKTLRQVLQAETGKTYAKGYLHKILRNRFYNGFFVWDGKTYKGTQERIISAELFTRVQEVFTTLNRPRYGRHEFAFSGLLACAYDHCRITAERKKERYTYYHCTGYKGKCELPYFREEELGDKLGQILKNIYIPDNVLLDLQNYLKNHAHESEAGRRGQLSKLQSRLTAIRSRLDQVYLDKLDGKISEEFWSRKAQDWQLEEQQVSMALHGLQQSQNGDRLLTANRILELVNQAYFLYLKQPPAEQAKLLKMVLSNCAIDSASLYPTYKKPFDVIFERAKNEEWRALRDSNSRPSDS